MNGFPRFHFDLENIYNPSMNVEILAETVSPFLLRG